MARDSIAYYWRFYDGQKLTLLLTSALLVLQPVALMATLYAVKYQFDSSVEAGHLLPLVLVSVGLVLLYVFSGGVALYIRYRMMRLTHTAISRLRREIVSRLYAFSRLSYAQFDRKQLQTVLVQDVIRVDVMTNAFAGQLIPGLVIVGTMGIFLMTINFTLFAVLACLFPVLALLERTLRPLLRQLIQGHHRSLEELQKKTLFGLEALDLTHSLGNTQLEIDEQVAAGSAFRRVSTRLSMLRESLSFAQDVVMLITSIVCLLLGAWFVNAQQMSLGELLAFYMAVLVMRPPLRTCWATLPQIIEGVESLKSINQWIHMPDTAPTFGHQSIVFQGEVSLQDVAFSYKDEPLLRDVNLHIPAGGVATILGPNGTGKSTLAYLLLGFYRPQSGTIRMDHWPLSDIAIEQLRRQMGVVPQHPLIFQGTIFDNIIYGALDTDEDAVREACRLANADEFIQSLPEAYSSKVGDGGMLLSGGQRQRIAIARALLGRPPLLILDEPSTHLDAQSVRAVMSGLRHGDYHPSILLITHDRALAGLGDDIYILESGTLTRQPNPPREPN